MRHQLCMRGCRPHASSSGTQTIQFTSAGISSCAVVMPKTKSSKCGQRGTQGPARHSARSLTRALTRSTVSAPTPSKRALRLSPIHWPRGLWSVGPHLRTSKGRDSSSAGSSCARLSRLACGQCCGNHNSAVNCGTAHCHYNALRPAYNRYMTYSCT